MGDISLFENTSECKSQPIKLLCHTISYLCIDITGIIYLYPCDLVWDMLSGEKID